MESDIEYYDIRSKYPYMANETNQDILKGKGTKDDKGKPDYLGIFTELELSFLIDCAKVLKHGRIKYTKDNWKKDLEPERIQKALLRHFVHYVNGEKLDQESGISHLCHIYANAQFLHYYDNKTTSNDLIHEACKQESNDLKAILDMKDEEIKSLNDKINKYITY